MSMAAAEGAETAGLAKRKSAVRVAVVQFNPQVGLENLEPNALAVRQRLRQAVRRGWFPHPCPA